MDTYYIKRSKVSICKNRIYWTIEDIFSFPPLSNTEICLPVLRMGDEEWQLRVFLNGKKSARTHGWLGVALVSCCDDISTNNNLTVTRIGLIGENEETVDCIPERFAECYLANKLIRRKEFNFRRHWVAPDGVLTIFCEVEIQDEMSLEPALDSVRKWLSEVTLKISKELAPESSSDADSSKKDSSKASAKEDRGSKNKDSVCSEVEYDEKEEASHSKIEYDIKDVGKSTAVLTKGISKLLQDLKELLDSETLSDLTIDCKAEQFRVNSGIMAARSPVFSKMLTHDMKEKASGLVTIQDMDPDVFRDFLEYVYTGRVQNLSPDNVQALFTAADKYQVAELREESLEYMKRNLSVKNFCGVMSLSLRHNEQELTALATEFFVKNASDIVKTCDWQVFMQENLVAANELFIKQMEASKH